MDRPEKNAIGLFILFVLFMAISFILSERISKTEELDSDIQALYHIVVTNAVAIRQIDDSTYETVFEHVRTDSINTLIENFIETRRKND